MKILMINKFLYPNGGSETYMFKLGDYLQSQGHEVEYFGMEHKDRCVGNRVNAYTSNMDFRGGSKFTKLTYPLKTIYSTEARIQLRKVLDAFQPDVCHLNNFNYQLTPSVILEIVKWRKENHNCCKIIYTAHDGQLVCPNHLMLNPISGQKCKACFSGKYINCVKGKCIHGSITKSVIGALEASIWRLCKVYRHIDTIICCSAFMKEQLDHYPILSSKTVVLHNFVEELLCEEIEKEEYVLYFGRYSKEKGIFTLIRICEALPHINFVFAGSGPLESELIGVTNIRNVGFQVGEKLKRIVQKAKFSLCTSECYENCPFSVMESQMCGTPVIGVRSGGVPELIQEGITGELYDVGNENELINKIKLLWSDKEKLVQYSENCKKIRFATIEQYVEKLMEIYK